MTFYLISYLDIYELTYNIYLFAFIFFFYLFFF